MTEHSRKSIDDLVFDVLLKSKSLDVFPTPVEKIVQYCELNNSKDSIHAIPKNYVAKNMDALQRALKKVLGAFDREQKIIYVDPFLPPVKKNFVKLHEVGHGVIPWQKEVNYQDDDHTLSLHVKEAYEIEANYFASAGLFQLNRFEDEMSKLPLEIASPMALAKKFGGSNHASIRRYAELSKKRCALLVLEDKQKKGQRNSLDLRNSFQSPSFTKDFGELTWPEKLNMDFPFIRDYSRNQKFHTDGSINLFTTSGFQNFTYHYFHNNYNVFILIIPTGEKNKSRTTIYMQSEPSFP